MPEFVDIGQARTQATLQADDVLPGQAEPGGVGTDYEIPAQLFAGVRFAAGAPAITPAWVGQVYVDTTADVAYVATDTASSADWDQITGGTVDTSGAPVATDFARFTDADTIEGRSPAEVRGDLDLEIGVDVQAHSAILDVTTVSFTGDAGNTTTGTFGDARIAQSSVTQHEGAINHDNLTGFVANEHLDWTTDRGPTNIAAANITGLTLGTEVTGASTALSDTTALTYNADADVSSNTWVLDEDTMSSNDAAKVPTQQSVKAYVDAHSHLISLQTKSANYTIVDADFGDRIRFTGGAPQFNTTLAPTQYSMIWITNATGSDMTVAGDMTTKNGNLTIANNTTAAVQYTATNTVEVL